MDGIMQVTVGHAPEHVRRFCTAWNLKSRKECEAGTLCAVSVAKITKASGRIHHHLRIDLPNGRRDSVSLGDIDGQTLRAGIRALLAKHHIKVPFEF